MEGEDPIYSSVLCGPIVPRYGNNRVSFHEIRKAGRKGGRYLVDTELMIKGRCFFFFKKKKKKKPQIIPILLIGQYTNTVAKVITEKS